MKVSVYWIQFFVIISIYSAGFIVGRVVESSWVIAVITLPVGAVAMALCIRVAKDKGGGK